MAVSFRAASSGQATSGTSQAVTQPTGAAAGDLVLVALNVRNDTAETFSAVTGWTLSSQDANAFNSTSAFKTAVYWRVLDGTESWPITFSWTATSVKHAWLAIAFTPGAGNTMAIDGEAAVKVDTTGASTHTANAQTAVAANVCSVIINCGRTSAASATAITVTAATNWTEPANGDTSTAAGTTAALSQLGIEACYRTGQSGTVTPGASTWSQSTVAANVYHFLLTDPAPITSGPPLGTLNQPAGNRVSLIRTGLAMATLLPMVVAGPPPTSGPPVTPLQQPAGIHKTLPPRGRVHRRAGTFQGTGPPVTPLRSPVGPGGGASASTAQPSRLPPHGRVYGISHAGTYGGTGPPVPALHSPVQAGDANPAGGQHLTRTRGGSIVRGSPGTRGNPGPPARPLAAPVRAAWPARVNGGAVRHLAGVYATLGPQVRPLTAPVRAPVPARTRGGTITRRAGTLSTLGPPVTPLRRPVRAPVPARNRGGRVFASPLTAVQAVVNVIAVYGAIPSPVRAALPVTPKGRTVAFPVKASTVITFGPPIPPRAQPVRAPVPQRTRGGVTRSSAGTRQGTGPPVPPLHRPVRAPLPPPALNGRAMAIAAIPAPSVFTPVAGPVIPARGQPWQAAARPLPPRGRAQSRAGSRNGTGPPVTPLHAPVRASWPARARGGTGHGLRGTFTAVAPASGPPIPLRAAPWRAALPAPYIRGFALAMAALPVTAAPAPTSGPPVTPLRSPVRPPVPARTRGGTVHHRAGKYSGTGPAVPPLTQPAAIRVVYARAGHVQSSRVTPAVPAASATLSGTGTLTGSWILGPSARLSGSGTLAGTGQVITPTPFTGDWHASPLPPRWQASPLPPRWHAGPVPARWHAEPVPTRWQASALPSRWRAAVTQFTPVASISLAYINAHWVNDLAGTEGVDPTGQTPGQNALPVQFAVPVSSGNTVAPAQPVTWYAASWLAGGNMAGYVAQGLAGPTGLGGAVQLTPGVAVDVWFKITGTPESPAAFVGTLPVY